MQPIIDSTVGGLVIGGQSGQKLAQTVTAGLDGRLWYLSMPIACSSGELVIQMRELDGDEPSSVVLRQREIPASSVLYVGPVFRLFWMTSSLPVAPGDRFAIVLQNPTGACGLFRSPPGDTYTGGEGFYSGPDEQWIRFFSTPVREDLPFMTLIRLP